MTSSMARSILKKTTSVPPLPDDVSRLETISESCDLSNATGAEQIPDDRLQPQEPNVQKEPPIEAKPKAAKLFAKKLKPVDSIRVASDRMKPSNRSRFLKRRSDANSPRLVRVREESGGTSFPFPEVTCDTSSASADDNQVTHQVDERKSPAKKERELETHALNLAVDSDSKNDSQIVPPNSVLHVEVLPSPDMGITDEVVKSPDADIPDDSVSSPSLPSQVPCSMDISNEDSNLSIQDVSQTSAMDIEPEQDQTKGGDQLTLSDEECLV